MKTTDTDLESGKAGPAPMTDMIWHDAPLVALDLEGTGAQDRDNEAILEIAAVPLTSGHPDLPEHYSTLINPGRSIPRSPWISPGLTNVTLANAPTLNQIRGDLLARLDGKILVGHNIGVDARLLRLRLPGIHFDGLIDTLKLARHIKPGNGNKLTELLDRHQLTDQVNEVAAGSRPHRALWDTIAAALLLKALIDTLPNGQDLTLTELRRIAGQPGDGNHNKGSKLQRATHSPAADQTSLLDL